MKSPDSESLERLFEVAAELSTTDRAEFLKSADPELAAKVHAMIVAARDPVWNGSALDLEARETAFDCHVPQPGEMVGAYRIVRRIAAGGMSFVYEAERNDAEFNKCVAIKFLQQGIRDGAGIERFRTERQILAQLEHPNIARLLDGGTSGDGVPYLVMEYVEGLPIDRFVTEHGLSRPERLALFLQVCEAVQYAHRKLVVHRDLKPANILVADKGTSKLLDFGIAKLLMHQSGTPTVTALTPEYASPEQVLARSITTATDIYSLGVLLFLILADRLPYVATSPAELVRAICERDPVWQPAGLIDRDLQSILALCLRKEPDQRYSSVEQLAADIRRYLEGRPVAARPDSLLYRARKFVARHPVPLAAAAAVLIAAMVGTLATLAESRRAARRFNEVRTLAHTVLYDVYDAISTQPDTLPARRLVASRAQQYLDALARDAAGDPALIRDLAESYLRLGDVRGSPYTGNLGDTAGAFESFRKGQALLDREIARHPGDAALRDLLFQIHVRLGRVLERQGNSAMAIAVLEQTVAEAEDRYRRKHDLASAEELSRADAALAEAQDLAAKQSGDLLAYRHALETSRKALAVLEAIGPLSVDSWQEARAARNQRIGYALCALGDRTGDRSYYRQALDSFLLVDQFVRQQAASHPGRAKDRALADDLTSMSVTRWKCCGDLKGATLGLRESLATFQRLAQEDPNNLEALRDVASAWDGMAVVLSEAGRRQEALESTRKVLAILEQLERADPSSAENADLLAEARARVTALEHGSQSAAH